MKRSLGGTYPAFVPHYLGEFQYRFNRRYHLAALALARPVLMSSAA